MIMKAEERSAQPTCRTIGARDSGKYARPFALGAISPAPHWSSCPRHFLGEVTGRRN
jgi:hypothetical protein